MTFGLLSTLPGSFSTTPRLEYRYRRLIILQPLSRLCKILVKITDQPITLRVITVTEVIPCVHLFVPTLTYRSPLLLSTDPVRLRIYWDTQVVVHLEPFPLYDPSFVSSNSWTDISYF